MYHRKPEKLYLYFHAPGVSSEDSNYAISSWLTSGTFFSLFVFVSAAGHYFRIWISHYLSIWIGQVPALLFLDKKYNIANSSCHFGFGPYIIFLVTNRSIFCHMTLSAMNYLIIPFCLFSYMDVKYGAISIL
jgi:hypothetical protein